MFLYTNKTMVKTLRKTFWTADTAVTVNMEALIKRQFFARNIFHLKVSFKLEDRKRWEMEGLTIQQIKLSVIKEFQSYSTKL